MKSPAIQLMVVFIWALSAAVSVAAPENKPKAEEASLVFGGVEYFHRWSKDGQHEYTPRGQEDLERWTDMVTINRYGNVTDGDGLAAMANAVLETYKKSGARILRTDSVPRTPDKPAEFLIVVYFPTPNFIEAAFNRFKIVGGIGTSSVYSHREYGKKIGDQMSAWLKTHGPTTEKSLMSWEDIPQPKK